MILTSFVCIVWLIVVVGNPFGVSGKHLSPSGIFSKVPIGEPSHQIELTFNQVLPGLSFLDILFLNSQARIDLLSLFRLENTSTI
jgi:hypothetical protein